MIIDPRKDPLFDFLYSWANQVLNQELCLDVDILESHTNAPPPKNNQDNQNLKPFITIKYTANKTKIGRASRMPVNDAGKSEIINDYTLVTEIWESNGTGQLLQELIDSIERTDIQQLWCKNGYAYISQGNIMTIPRTQDEAWKTENIVEITIATARSTSTKDKTGYIDKVNYKGTIPAQGRTGNHNIEESIDSTI